MSITVEQGRSCTGTSTHELRQEMECEVKSEPVDASEFEPPDINILWTENVPENTSNDWTSSNVQLLGEPVVKLDRLDQTILDSYLKSKFTDPTAACTLTATDIKALNGGKDVTVTASTDGDYHLTDSATNATKHNVRKKRRKYGIVPIKIHKKNQAYYKSNYVPKCYPCDLCDKSFNRIKSLEKHKLFHQGDRPFVCNECPKNFSSMTYLRQHLKTHSTERPFVCEQCNKAFRRLDRLKLHKQVHLGLKPYVCDKCGKRFVVRRNMIIHRLKRHAAPGDVVHTCKICEKTFACQPDLREHVRAYHERRYACEFCPKTFRTHAHLTAHLLIHAGIKQFKCTECGKMFRRIQHLNRHTMVHTGDLPYKCPLCDRRFAQAGNMRLHLVIHTDNKPFACSFCGLQFKRRSGLKLHEMRHTGAKPYSCETCGKRFTQSSGLAEHRVVHTTVKPHMCNICGKLFKLASSLRYHVANHENEKEIAPGHIIKTPKTHRCKICHEVFPSGARLQVHRGLDHSMGRYKCCPLCDKTYSETSHLKKHLLSHERPFKCDVCRLRFTKLAELKEHYGRHNKLKPYGCNLCGRMFTRKAGMARHLVENCEFRPEKLAADQARQQLLEREEQGLLETNRLHELENMYLSQMLAMAAHQGDIGSSSSTLLGAEGEAYLDGAINGSACVESVATQDGVGGNALACGVVAGLGNALLDVTMSTTASNGMEIVDSQNDGLDGNTASTASGSASLGEAGNLAGACGNALLNSAAVGCEGKSSSKSKSSRKKKIENIFPRPGDVSQPLSPRSFDELTERVAANAATRPLDRSTTDNSANIPAVNSEISSPITMDIVRTGKNSNFTASISHTKNPSSAGMSGANVTMVTNTSESDYSPSRTLSRTASDLLNTASGLSSPSNEPLNLVIGYERADPVATGEQSFFQASANESMNPAGSELLTGLQYEPLNLATDDVSDYDNNDYNDDDDDDDAASDKTCDYDNDLLRDTIGLPAEKSAPLIDDAARNKQSVEQAEKALAGSSSAVIDESAVKVEPDDAAEAESQPTERQRHKRTPAGNYVCSVCNKEFRLVSRLNGHAKIHTGVRPHRCEECGKSFMRRIQLKWHMMIHSNTKPFECQFCGKAFVQNGNLKIHLLTHNDEKAHKCRYCDKTFKRKDGRRLHEMKHTGLKPQVCNVCGKQFSQYSNLQHHMLVHSAVKNVMCTDCGKMFRDRGSLKQHMVQHTGVKAYACEICDERFMMSTNRKLHMLRVHDIGPRHVCQLCNKLFLTPSSLSQHIRAHSFAKPYVCPLCGKKFRQLRGLKTHDLHHSDRKKFGCGRCGRGFVRKRCAVKHFELRCPLRDSNDNPEAELMVL